MDKNIFRAYDIRGRYPQEINAANIFLISQALARFFKTGSIIIGHDVRIGSRELYRAVFRGLKTNPKLKIIPLGLATTPMFYFLVNYFKSRGGIMITPSHNPKEYNGLKIVGPKAQMISGKQIWRLLKNYQ